LFNVEVSAKVLGVAMLCEIAVIAIWDARVFWEGGPDGVRVPMFNHLFDGSVALAFLFIAMCMTGFESLQVFREETRDPDRTVPRATIVVVAALAVFYAVSTYAYIVSEGFGSGLTEGAANPTGTLLASMDRYAGAVLADAASLLLMTSSFACTLAIQNITARYLYALGRDRVVPARLGKVSERHGSPLNASLVSGALICMVLLLPMLGKADPIKTYTVLLGLGGYGIVLLWAVTSASVLVFFKRNPEEHVSKWSSTIAPALSLLGLGTILWLATKNLGLLVGDLGTARVILVFAGGVAAVGGALALWWRVRNPAVYETIGRQEA
ncbi:APC family permease, partial [Nocardioides sp. AN3]